MRQDAQIEESYEEEFTARITAAGVVGTDNRYAWQEVALDGSTGDYVELGGGRFGDFGQDYLLELNNQVVTTPLLVRARLRGADGETQVFEFEAPAGSTAGGGGGGTITVKDVSGSPTITGVNTITVDSTTALTVTAGAAGVAALANNFARGLRTGIAPAQAGVIDGANVLGGNQVLGAGNKFFPGLAVFASPGGSPPSADEKVRYQNNTAGTSGTDARDGQLNSTNFVREVMNTNNVVGITREVWHNATVGTDYALGTFSIVADKSSPSQPVSFTFGASYAGGGRAARIFVATAAGATVEGGTTTTGGLTFQSGLYISGAIAPATQSAIWRYSTNTTIADPSAGNYRINTGLFTSATQMAISRTTDGGTDVTNTLKALAVGDIIQVQDQSNSANWARYTISAVTNNTTWFQFGLTFVSGAGSAVANNTQCLFTFTVTSGGAGVPATRLINTTPPLTGGGDLSADRTLAVSDFTSAARGTVPASGGGTAKFLRADGAWAAAAVWAVSSQSASFTAATTPTSYYCSSASASITATLPPAAGNAGLRHSFKKTSASSSANLVTIKGNASENIISRSGTANTLSLYYQGDQLELECDGTSWYTTIDGRKPIVYAARRAAAQSIPDNTVTTISLDTATVDAMGMLSGGATTIKRAGVYQIQAYWAMTGTNVQLYVQLNGPTVLLGCVQTNAAASSFMSCTVFGFATLAAGDILYLTGLQAGTGAAQNTSTNENRPALNVVEQL